jgi:hypothetical protein
MSALERALAHEHEAPPARPSRVVHVVERPDHPELQTLLTESQCEDTSPAVMPATLRRVWRESLYGTRKFTAEDIDGVLVAFAELVIRECRGRARYFWPGPGGFLKDLANRNEPLTVGQAKGVLNTIVAGVRVQRRRFHLNNGDGTDRHKCVVCGLNLDDEQARRFGCGDVCWTRVLRNWS